jgi:uncharacterized membrane protein (UPF0127 family)
MKKVLLPILAVFLFVGILGFVYQKTQTGEINLPSQVNTLTKNTKKIQINNTDVYVEIARSQEERAEGLSGRETLAADQGMLFIFEEKDVTRAFWMKGMLFPLDFLWINDGEIIQIDENVQAPVPNTPDSELTLLTPFQPVDYVLEVNGGFAAKNNIQVGDEVNLEGI